MQSAFIWHRFSPLLHSSMSANRSTILFNTIYGTFSLNKNIFPKPYDIGISMQNKYVHYTTVVYSFQEKIEKFLTNLRRWAECCCSWIPLDIHSGSFQSGWCRHHWCKLLGFHCTHQYLNMRNIYRSSLAQNHYLKHNFKKFNCLTHRFTSSDINNKTRCLVSTENLVFS